MGKKKGKKDPEKKAALAARKEAKADKKELKRVQKQTKGPDGEDIIDVEENGDTQALDALLEQYQQQGKNDIQTAYTEKVETTFPLARANATLTLYEDTKKKNAEVFLFGGEYFDGSSSVVLNHLYKFDISKGEWKRVFTPNPTPPARCAHSTVYYNHALYVFGGELASADQYHHYRDVYKYDIRKQSWQEIRPNKAEGTHPSARSGHAAAVWKHYMIVFGGFYEAAKDAPRWFNDVCIMDLQTQQWLDLPHSKLTARPEPRSACNVDVIGDDLVVHGGFSKLGKTGQQQQQQATATGGTIQHQHQQGGGVVVMPVSETKVHTDAWVLHLKPLLQGKPPVWERLTSSIQRKQLAAVKSANGRSGSSAVAYKNRLLVYGGVVDTEQHHHKMDSVFYNDLFAFDVEKRKWFPVHVKKAGGGDGSAEAGNRRQEAQAEDDAGSDAADLGEDDDDDETTGENTGWNLEKLRSDMFAFTDGEGNVVYEKIDEEGEKDGDSDDDEEEEEKEEEKEESDEEKESDEPAPVAVSKKKSRKPEPSRSKTFTSSSVMKLNPETKAPEPVSRAEPLPRIQSSLFINGHTLYVYGGLLEVGDREVTLDDLWSLDLRKRNNWECVWPGTMHQQVWRGAVHDDDDSYYSTDTGRNKEESEDEDDSDDEGFGSELKIVTMKPKKKSRSEIKQEIAQLNEQYELTDENQTPEYAETLADFYSRTSDYWNEKAAQTIKVLNENAELSTKELKRQGFSLAKDRFDGLEDVLAQLTQLILDKKETKKEPKDKSSSKKKSR